MNFSDVLKALNSASAFELFRMSAAINRVLDEPRWVPAIRPHLQIGQMIEYFDVSSNTLHRAKILELLPKRVLVLDNEDGKRWRISYAAVNIDGADVQIQEQAKQGLGRNEVAVGEVVGFLDREQRQRSGRITRLNVKTVTLLCNQQQWRVPYSLLHRVVESHIIEQNALELDVAALPQK